jgi:hypothetical protein
MEVEDIHAQLDQQPGQFQRACGIIHSRRIAASASEVNGGARVAVTFKVFANRYQIRLHTPMWGRIGPELNHLHRGKPPIFDSSTSLKRFPIQLS